MKICMSLVAALSSLILFTGHAHAAPPHTIRWQPRSAQPGDVVTLGGQQFILVRVPVRDLGGTRRFAVSFLTLRQGAVSPAGLGTLHHRDPIQDPIDIDGFDASVTISDGRNYNILNNFISPGDFTFTVTAHASCTVNIKLGQTLISIFGFIQITQQPATNIGSTPNAVPHAEWDDYRHPTAQVTACNNFIDYIRIQELN